MFNIAEMHWEFRWQDQPSGTLILQLALGAMAAWHKKWTPCLSIDTIQYAIYIYNVHIQYIWYMSQYMIYFPSFAAGRDTVTDLWSRSLFRRSCGCGLCWSLAAADGSIQAKKFLGQSMEIFHGDRCCCWGQLDMSGTISTEISTLITEIGMLHSHSGWAGTAPVVIRKPYSQSNCTLKISQLIFTMSLIDSCW